MDSANPKPENAPPQLASLHGRLLALILDYAFVTAALKLLDQATQGNTWDLSPDPWRGKIFLLLLPLLLLLRDLPPKGSPGKWLLGLALRDKTLSEHPPPLWKRILRNTTLVLGPAEAFLAHRDPCYRRLGDRLGDTLVLAQSSTPALRRLLILAMLIFSSLLAFMGLAQRNIHRSAAYQHVLQEIEAPELRKTIGGYPEIARIHTFALQEDHAEIVLELDGAHGTFLVSWTLLKNHPKKNPAWQTPKPPQIQPKTP